MTTSTPPAWGWLDECYVPNAGTDHEYGQMREEALSSDPRNLPDAATLGVQNDSGTEPEVSSSTTRKLEPDPTGEDVWPLERAALVTVTAAECAADKLCDVHVAKCPVCLHEVENDEGILCDHCEEPTGLESLALVYGHSGVFVYHLKCYDEVYWDGHDTGQEADDVEVDTIPLWKQALWLVRHIKDLHSPRPDELSDDELRGMTLIRVLGIGADEHGDEVFRKTHKDLARDRTEEWSDGEFYDLVDRFGGEL